MFESRLELHIHLNAKHTSYVQQNWEVCKFCLDEYFPSTKELNDHINEHHSEVTNRTDEAPPEILELEDDDVLIEVMPTSTKTTQISTDNSEKLVTKEICVIPCPHCKSYEAEKWSIIEQHIKDSHPDKYLPASM